MSFRVDNKDKKDIEVCAKKHNMKVSEFIYQAVIEKMQTKKLNESQNQFIDLFDISFKKSFENYFKQMVVILNRIEFNTKWILKQQDIFMQHLKVPQTMEELNVSVIEHPITTKSQELVLKDIRKMSLKKHEVEDE